MEAEHAPPPPVEPVAVNPARLPSLPVRGRDRLRLLALIGMVIVWTVPKWVDAQSVTDGIVRPEHGAHRTGVMAALALMALWGLSVTSLAVTTRRGVRIGSALTDFVLALTTGLLLVAEHPWIPGGPLREAWVPIFLPLALLALLDAIVLAIKDHAGPTVRFIRAGAALFASVALVVDGSWVPSMIALMLALGPLAQVSVTDGRGARRMLEQLTLLWAAIAGLAPWIQRDLVEVNPAVGQALTVPIYIWCVLAALVLTTALDGVARPEAEEPIAGAR